MSDLQFTCTAKKHNLTVNIPLMQFEQPFMLTDDAIRTAIYVD